MGNVFGLGILLTLDDQASSKITGVGNSLQQLSQKAMYLNYMGRSLIDTGKAMLSPVVGLSKEIIRVNESAEKARITLNALYQDPAKGAAKYAEIVDYAAKTPFEITELRDAALQFKTLGVEILGTDSYVKSSSGNVKEFMTILGDMGAGLSGVARNGFKDVTYAVREFVTEGNQLSFLRRLGVDIDAVLTKAGKKVGETIEERLVNMADLAEILKFEDLTGKMFNTWGQVISNMSDVWEMFLLGVGDSDSGILKEDKFGNTVFGGFKRTLGRVQELLTGLNLYGFGQAIGKGLGALIDPLDTIAAKLVEVTKSVMEFIGTHPEVAKYALLLPTIAGALFIIAGAGLIAKASMLTFSYGLGAMVGMIPRLLVLAGAFSVIYTAWSKDIGGIRTKLTGFVNTVRTSMKQAKEILGMDADDMVNEYKRLVNRWDKAGDFGAGLTAQIIKFKVLWGAFTDFLSDNKVDPKTLGILDDMGLLGTFEKIATWTSRVKDFCRGVVEGFSDMANAVGKFVSGAMSLLFPKSTSGKGSGMFNMLTGSFKDSGADLSGLGNFAIKALPAVWALKKVIDIVNKLTGSSKKTKGGLFSILDNLTGGKKAAGGSSRGAKGLARILGDFGNMKMGVVLKGATNLGLVLTAFMGLSAVFGGFVNLFGADTMFKGIAALGAISVAMLPLGTPIFNTLINTLQRLARFKVKTISKGILNLGIIVGGIAAISAISLSLMAIPLAFMDIGAMYAMVGVLYLMSVLGVALSTVASVIGKIPVSTVALGLANMAIMLGGLAALFAIIGAVSLIPFDLGRVTVLTLVIGLIGTIATALSLFAGIVGMIPVSVVALGLANMAIMLGGLSVLYMVLGAVSLIPFDMGRVSQLVLVIGLIGTIATALSIFAGIVGVIPVPVVALGLANMAIMLGGLSVLYMVLGAVSLIPFDLGRISQLVLVIGLIGAVGTALSIFAGIAGAIPITMVLKGIANISLALAGFGTLAYAFSYVTKYESQIEEGCRVITKVAKGIGQALGSLVGGVLEGVTNSLPKIAENIAGFVTNLNPLINLAKNKDSTQIGTFLKSLGDGLLAITKNDLLSVFTGGTNFASLAEDLNGFATALVPFFSQVDSVSEKSISKATGIFKALQNINSQAFMKGGVNDFWNGSIDLTSLGTQLADFATSVSPFFGAVDGVNESAFPKAEKMFASLEGINKQAFMNGGVNDFWNGTIDLTSLGTQLSNFAPSIVPFFTQVASIDESSFSKAENMFKCLEGINQQAFMSGGVNDFWNGSIDLTNLGAMLADFAESAGTFWTTIATWDESSFSKAEKLFTALKVINDEAFKDGGVTQWWSGTVDLSGLGEQLSGFATNAESFFLKINVINNPSSIHTIFSALKNNIPQLKDVTADNLPTLGSNLSSFMTNASSFFTQASTVDVSGLATIATSLTDFFGLINSVVIPDIANIQGSISGLIGSLVSVGSQLITMGGEFITLGNYAIQCGTNVVSGMTMITTYAPQVGSVIMSSAVIAVAGLTLLSSSASTHSALVVSAFILMGNGVMIGVTLVTNGMTQMVASVTTGMSEIASAVQQGSALMVSYLTSAVSQCQSVLSSFASSGYGYGSSLVSNIAAGISDNAGQIKSAIQAAVASAAGSVSIKIPIKIPQNYNGTNNWVGGLTTINERGGELVDLPSGTRIYPHDKSVTMAFDEGMKTAMSNKSKHNDNSVHDDSVHFHAGSIVVQANGVSDAEAERLAGLIIEKIERKQRRKALATYAY